MNDWSRLGSALVCWTGCRVVMSASVGSLLVFCMCAVEREAESVLQGYTLLDYSFTSLLGYCRHRHFSAVHWRDDISLHLFQSLDLARENASTDPDLLLVDGHHPLKPSFPKHAVHT